MHQPMNLEELKTEAQKQNYLVIRREGESAWRPLKNWKGHPSWGSVSYILIGNRVLVRTGRENDVSYTLT